MPAWIKMDFLTKLKYKKAA